VAELPRTIAKKRDVITTAPSAMRGRLALTREWSPAHRRKHGPTRMARVVQKVCAGPSLQEILWK
jgi:hypothetical protein